MDRDGDRDMEKEIDSDRDRFKYKDIQDIDRERNRTKNRNMDKENDMDRDRNFSWYNKMTGAFFEIGKWNKEHWAEQRQKKNRDMGRGQRLLNKGQGWG